MNPLKRTVEAFAIAVAVLATLAASYPGLLEERIDPDAWAYLELSSTVFGDFYRLDTLRQFDRDYPYSNSFPPLWPVCIGLTRVVGLDAGIYTVFGLAVVASLGVMFALRWLFGRLDLPRWVGVLAYVLLLCSPPYTATLTNGSTIPLALLVLVLLTGVACVAPEVSPRRAAACGALAALGCLTRFDFLPVAAAVGLHLCVRGAAGRRWQTAAWVLLGFAPLFAPHVGFNLYHFGKPLASDNTRQVLLSRPSHVTTYYEDVSAQSTLTTDARGWVRGLAVSKAPAVAKSALFALLTMSVLPTLLAVYLVARPVGLPPPEGWGAIRRVAAFALLATACHAGPMILTGYAERRYFSAWILLGIVTLCGAIATRLPVRDWSRSRVVVLLVFAGAAAVWQSRPPRLGEGGFEGPALKPRFDAGRTSPEMDSLAAALRREPGGDAARVLIGSTTGGDEFMHCWSWATKFGALTRVPTSPPPVLVGSPAAFVRDFRIGYLYDPRGAVLAVYERHVVAEPLSLPGLYHIRPRTAAPQRP